MITVDPRQIGVDGVLRAGLDALVDTGPPPRSGTWIEVALPDGRTTQAYVLLADPDHNVLNLALADFGGTTGDGEA
jgi:hypothetical protein